MSAGGESGATVLGPCGSVPVVPVPHATGSVPIRQPGACPTTVLIAEARSGLREQLKRILCLDGGFEVAGEATDGREAVELAKRLRPNVVVIGARLPVLNGFQATKEIMIAAPTPTVMLASGVEAIESLRGVTAYQAGALSFLPDIPDTDAEDDVRRFLDILKTAARTKVTRHWRIVPSRVDGPDIEAIAAIVPLKGAPAFREILSQLPKDFPAPILVVPALGHGLGTHFQAWLSTGSALEIKVAAYGDPLAPGTVYLAPEDHHLVVSPHSTPCAMTSRADPVRTFRPSGVPLLESIAASFGPAAAVLLMDGLREDVVLGLCAVWLAGGRVIVHEKDRFASQVEEFISGLADASLTTREITELIVRLTRRKPAPWGQRADAFRLA